MTKQDEVYEDLRRRIVNGEYASWGSLENEAVLCKRYGVSRPTLQKAVARLKQDGLVHSRQGSGVFVNPPEFYGQYNMRSFTEQQAGTGHVVTNEVLTFEHVEAGDLAGVFHLEPADNLIHYLRLRYLDGRAYLIDDSCLPEYLFKDFPKEVLLGSTVAYMEKDCGYSISHSIRRVHALAASPEVARLLGVKEGVPLLQTEQTIYLTRNVAIQFTREVSLQQEVTIVSVR